MESLERFENLERIQHLKEIRGKQIKFSYLSFSDFSLKDFSKKKTIIYCDPPYRNTKEYKGINFNFKAFDKWCEKCKFPLFVSEYTQPDNSLKEVFNIPKRNTFCATANIAVTERLFSNNHLLKKVLDKQNDKC